MNKRQTGLIIASLTLTTILLVGTMSFLSGQSAEETRFLLSAKIEESKNYGIVLECTGKLFRVDPNSSFAGFVIVSDLTTQTQVAKFTVTKPVNAANPIQEGGTEGVIRDEDDACPVGSSSEQSVSPQTTREFFEPNDFAAFGPTAGVPSAS